MDHPRRLLDRPRLLAAILLAGATLLAACSSPAVTSEQAASLSVVDPWIKAADSGMTAAFGTLVNSAAEPVSVVGASSDAAERMELHETVMNDAGEMAMSQIEGGLVVAAGGERSLEPGGDHLMLLGITDPIEPGEDVVITLALEDGSELTFSASARSFAGAEETYDDVAPAEQ